MADMATVEEQAKPAMETARQKVREKVQAQKPKVQAAMSKVEEYSPPIFMGLSLASIIASMTLFFQRKRDTATFVGLWAPTFLSLGLFYTLIGAWRKK